MNPIKLRVLGENKGNHWIATCLEFNLVSEGSTFEAACEQVEKAVEGYLKVIFDTDDPLSIPALLNRPAPRSKYIKFAVAEKIHNFRDWKANFFAPPKFSLHSHAHAT